MQKNKNICKTPFNSASVFFSIFALVLIAIGVYLKIDGQSAAGISQPGRHGQGGGTVLKIPGGFVNGLGVFFALFPIIDLIRYLRTRV